MLQATQFTAMEHPEPGQDRSDRVLGVSAVERVQQNVDWAIRGDSVSGATDPRGNIALSEAFTGGKRIADTRIIDLPPISPRLALGASLHAVQEWEGYIVEIRETEFVARLVDLTAEAFHEEEEATIPRAELSDGDDAGMRNGSIFRWVIGYERSPAGTKKRVSQIVFRDLPALTRSDLRDGEAWAREMAEALGP